MDGAKEMVDALVRRRRSGLAATVALGGLALIAGLAARSRPGGPGAAAPSPGAAPSPSPSQSSGAAPAPASTPDAAPAGASPSAPATPFDHGAIGEEEARIMLRAMVAATMVDGLLDANERMRLDAAVVAAGIAEDGRAWLAREIAEPADIDAIADAVHDPDRATRVYAAARLAIDPDTMQERQFLKMLAEALDVPPDALARLEAEIAA